MRSGMVVGSLVIATVLCSPTAAVLRAQSAVHQQCYRKFFTEPPGWVSSGTFTADGRVLLVADALNHRIMRYSSTARSLGAMPGPAGPAVAALNPSTLKRNALSDKFLIEVRGGGRIIALDNEFRPLAAHAGETSTLNRSGMRISGLYQWEPLGEEIIAYTDIQGPKETEWTTGWVRYPMVKPEHFSVILPGRHSDPARTFNRLGYQYLTSLGPTAYFLLMDSTPAIYRYANDEQGLKLVTTIAKPIPELAQAPVLPTLRSTDDVVPLMAAVERSAMPAGLYGWENFLYLLSRSPTTGGTKWTLTKLDPNTGDVRGQATIPSSTAHLTVVPGTLYWSVIEKESVRGFGDQNINSSLFLAADLLRGDLAELATACRGITSRIVASRP